MAYPLFELDGKSVKFKWLERHQQAFEKLKEIFIEEKILAFPDLKKPYILRTDASGFAISAILSQLDDNNKEKIVLCISRTLKGPQLNYYMTEKEMLAIVWALRKLLTYLLGAKICVITDHKAIIFFNKCKFTNNRIMRWMLAIQDFDISFEHIKGKLNVAADVLSRNHDDYVNSKRKFSEDICQRKIRAENYWMILKI